MAKLTEFERVAFHRGLCRGKYPARMPELGDRRTLKAWFDGLTDEELGNLVPLAVWTHEDFDELRTFRHWEERKTSTDARDRYLRCIPGEVIDAVAKPPPTPRKKKPYWQKGR